MSSRDGSIGGLSTDVTGRGVLVAGGVVVIVLLTNCWRTPVAQATCDQDLVYLKVASAAASSFDNTPDWAPPANAMAPVDGSFDTRWSSQGGMENQWIVFDFDRPKTLCKVVIHWERAYATDYELQVSDDGNIWKPLTTQTGQDGGVDEIIVPETTTRHVKLLAIKRSNPDWGISIWELDLSGPQRANPDDRPVEQVFPNRKAKESVTLVREDPLPSPGPISPAEFQKGMVYLSYHENHLATADSDAMLERLANLHVTHVAIVVSWYQDSVTDGRLYPESPQGGRTPVDEAIIHAINKCHALGLKVMLKPHVDVQAGDYRGEIQASEAWFANYEPFILRYAALAKSYNVELFCVGTELAGTTLGKWDSQWRALISQVRAAYPGPIVYGANWDEYKRIGFWDLVDYIGIDAYFPLTDKTDPTTDELVAGWTKHADAIEQWLTQEQIDKPVIFTEVGYGSADGVNRTPWAIPSQREDQTEQAACLDAMLTVLANRPWFKGVYWWGWFSQEVASPLGYPLRGKLAEGVLSRWYQTIH